MPSAPEAAPSTPEPEALRAEHESLASRLAARRSVDALRSGLQQVFFGLLCLGLTVKLGWDRFGTLAPGAVRKVPFGPPILLALATAATLVLLVLSFRSFLRSRRLAREEDGLFARFRQVRSALGIDP